MISVGVLLLVASLATGTTAAQSSDAVDLEELLDEAYKSGPVSYKSVEAALHTDAALTHGYFSSDMDTVEDVVLTGGSVLLMGWTANGSALTLAFNGTGATLGALGAQRPAPFEADNFYRKVFGDNGTVGDPVADPFQALMQRNGQGLTEAIHMAIEGVIPARIVVTGYAEGGALAKLAAAWAAAAYPSAHIRLVTFGAQYVGDARFSWALQRLVDLQYDWALAGDPRTARPSADLVAQPPLQLAAGNGSAAATAPTYSWPQYKLALANYVRSSGSQRSFAGSAAGQSVEQVNDTPSTAAAAPAPAPSPPPGCDKSGSGGIGGFFNNIANAAQCGYHTAVNAVSDEYQKATGILKGVYTILDVAKKEVFRGDSNSTAYIPFLNLTTEAAACPPILCKTRPAADASCNVYHDGLNTIAQGSVTIKDPNTDATAAVAWLSPNQTAVIAFRGSKSTKDWEADFKQWLSDDPLSPALENIFPGVHVHHGFLNQFQSLSDKAANSSTNIRDVLATLSGGREPQKVITTGHSLGAGLASIAAVWAALQWPAADVRCVTFGSPAVGNQAWANAYKAVVGGQYRVVDRLDIVPALPPFKQYVQVDYPYWILDNGTVLAEKRPYIDPRQLNWDDHACSLYKKAQYNRTHVAAPQWVTGEQPI